MARRKARKGGKIQPAVKTLAFRLTNDFSGSPGEGPGPVNIDTIDLSQCASLVNRRFYRQGLNWAVAGFTLYTAAPDPNTGLGAIGATGISKISDTWIASNSWEKGFRAWLKMNNEALEDTESVKPKFLDFKVFMDTHHHTNGVGANLIPQDADGNVYTLGEWDYSSVHIPDTTTPGTTDEREIIWTGANFPGVGASGLNAVSLIEGYAASRGLPNVLDPNVPDDASSIDGIAPQNWLSALDNEGITQDADVVSDLITENNLAPYPFENDGVHTDTMYPGGANQAPGLEIVSSASVSATTIGRRTELPGTNFQGGLIRVANQCADDYKWEQAPTLLVHLVPGLHRGYMCQDMKDV